MVQPKLPGWPAWTCPGVRGRLAWSTNLLKRIDAMSTNTIRPDDPRHNFLPKIKALRKAGEIPQECLSLVDICHDDWCGFHRGGVCNCDPDVRVRASVNEVVIVCVNVRDRRMKRPHGPAS